jgi:hypothetical protein
MYLSIYLYLSVCLCPYLSLSLFYESVQNIDDMDGRVKGQGTSLRLRVGFIWAMTSREGDPEFRDCYTDSYT